MKKQLHAFTLTELLVVLVIIGILMLIALPNLMPLIAKTHSIEAQQSLTTIQKLQNLIKFRENIYFCEIDSLFWVFFTQTDERLANRPLG